MLARRLLWSMLLMLALAQPANAVAPAVAPIARTAPVEMACAGMPRGDAPAMACAATCLTCGAVLPRAIVLAAALVTRPMPGARPVAVLEGRRTGLDPPPPRHG